MNIKWHGKAWLTQTRLSDGHFRVKTEDSMECWKYSMTHWTLNIRTEIICWTLQMTAQKKCYTCFMITGFVVFYCDAKSMFGTLFYTHFVFKMLMNHVLNINVDPHSFEHKWTVTKYISQVLRFVRFAELYFMSLKTSYFTRHKEMNTKVYSLFKMLSRWNNYMFLVEMIMCCMSKIYWTDKCFHPGFGCYFNTKQLLLFVCSKLCIMSFLALQETLL